MVTIGRVALVAALTLGAALPAAGQIDSTTRRGVKDPRVAAWQAAVRTHVQAKIDEPLTTVAAWPTDAFDRVLKVVLPDEDAAFLARALVLHTDIALAQRTLPETPPPSGGPVAVVVIDGQRTRTVTRSPHWAVARRIAAELVKQSGPDPAAIVAAWYRASCALMQEWGDLDTLEAQLEAGVALFGRDPVLALQRGTLHQAFGDARLADYARERRALTAMRRNGIGTVASIGGRNASRPDASASGLSASRAELNVAEREFRRALALDPTLHEARIRLAHVLSQLGNDRQAVEVVQPAAEADLPPFSAFYAAMILGRSQEHLGRFAEAGAAYDRAAAHTGGAQSAEIGRSRVALAQGRPAEALTIVTAVTAQGVSPRDDPWTVYFRFHDPDAETLMLAWRERVK